MHFATGNYAEATRHLREALKLRQACADQLAQQALDIHASADYQPGQAKALWLLSRILLAAREVTAAEDLAQQALCLYRELGNQHGEANALLELGRARALTHHHAEATVLLARARELFRSAKDVQGDAEAINSIGDLLAVTDVLSSVQRPAASRAFLLGGGCQSAPSNGHPVGSLRVCDPCRPVPGLGSRTAEVHSGYLGGLP
ncbi:tetratricopeptide repeat protein [Streptomyces sp. NPDC050844]|uniref:tetratricopeptide repeat protein n=1 Tax=Streptomyces sp. NPDC050844 TaxID=3155790 RepID=UPI0033E9BC91